LRAKSGGLTLVGKPTILVVDDTPQNIRLLEAMLVPAGYAVRGASSGEAALVLIAEAPPDIVLLDLIMPGIDGHEVCRRVRQMPNGTVLPVIMVTSLGDEQKVRAIEAGADDFIARPIHAAELLARIRSLLRVKQYHDMIQQQAAELAEWNRTLEERVQRQVEELERASRLRRFLPPQIADIVVSSGGETLLESHRREITVVFCDLRGFTTFAETAEPEEVMRVLAGYHQAMGEIIFSCGGTLERFAGDGLMVFFNDPLPCPDPTGAAVSMAIEMRQRARGLIEEWHRQGHELNFGVGIALGYATLGCIGFESRFDYAAIGTVTNLASRLCDEALGGQILINQRGYAAIESSVHVEPLGERPLKGFVRPTTVFNILDLKPDS
jgi:class 3 adenylate cyclase/CheY-like chemotaxis protein